MKLRPEHVIGARGMLGLSQAALANAAGLSQRSVERFERGETTLKEDSLLRIQVALEQRGIEFFNGNSPGVRFHPERALIPKGS